MSIINIKCIDQTLTITNTPLISSGDIQTDSLKFEFCPMWNDFKKTAIFYKNESEVYAVPLDTNSEAIIPKEVLQTEGFFYFGVHGVSGDKVRTSQILKYRVVKGAIADKVITPDPTTYAYEQLMKRIDEAEILIYYASETQINQLLESSAEGDGLITLTRLNQYNQGVNEKLETMRADTEAQMVYTNNEYEYGGA